jgi:hypothetical protein
VLVANRLHRGYLVSWPLPPPSRRAFRHLMRRISALITARVVGTNPSSARRYSGGDNPLPDDVITQLRFGGAFLCNDRGKLPFRPTGHAFPI